MIEPFTDGISTWIVRHGHRLPDVIHGVQVGNYIILKALDLIDVNAGQNPIDIEPFVDYNFGDGKCLLVVSSKGLTEFGESISQHTKIFSLPPLDGSTFKKSIHNRSRGLLVTSVPCCACGPV